MLLQGSIALNGASSKCIDQITGLIEVIDSGANIDANGDTITEDYISENATREIDAVRKQTKCI